MAKRIVNTEKGKAGRVLKKSVPVKTVKKKDGTDTVQESLVRELRGLIPKLDAEGLAFLVEQARVHIYNMQVEKLNQAAEAASIAAVQSKSLIGKIEKSRAQGASKEESFRIVGTESGSSYYLYCPNDSIMFSRNEMVHLVKTVNAGGTDLEIRERLYNWFVKERRDIFTVISIADKFDGRLKTLAALIKKTFKLQGG